MPRQLATIEEILSILRETPARLDDLTEGISADQLHTAPHPGEWSVNEILAHLRACADMWGDAIETIVAKDHPTIRAVNPTTWIETTDYREMAFASSLRALATQRRRLLDVLERLLTEDWSRSATVVGAGAPLERTVQAYADRLARHERAHWRQVEKTVKLVQA